MGRRMTQAERALALIAARHVHSDTRCVYITESVDELPALDVPAELNRRQARCVVCGRAAEESDELAWSTAGARA